MQSPGLNISDETRGAVDRMLESPEWNEINAIVITIVNKANEGYYGYPSSLYFDKISALIDRLNGIMEGEVRFIRSKSDELYQRNVAMTWILLVVTVVAQLVAFAYVWRTLKEVSTKIKEYGESLFDGATHTARASSELSSSSADLSSGMSEQAAALQQTVSALEQVRTMVDKNADSAARAKEVMVVASASAKNGKEAVEGMTHAIVEIRDSTTAVQGQVEASNAELSEILKVISEIGSKTKVINDIVFQTKLLSFNASVEAARAGEHGKGFAVVAEEVGNLAQMSGTSAREISQLLDRGIKRVEAIIADSKQRLSGLIQEANGKVEIGTNTAHRLGEAFQEISGKIFEVSDRVAEIAAASQEQSQGVNEITKAMHQLEAVTNRSNEAAGRSANSAGKLSDQAKGLEGISRQLDELVHGHQARLKTEPGRSSAPAGVGGTATRKDNRMSKFKGKLKVQPKVQPKFQTDGKKAPAAVISLSERRNAKSAHTSPASAPAQTQTQIADATGAKRAAAGGAAKADEVPSATDSRFEEI